MILLPYILASGAPHCSARPPIPYDAALASALAMVVGTAPAPKAPGLRLPATKSTVLKAPALGITRKPVLRPAPQKEVATLPQRMVPTFSPIQRTAPAAFDMAQEEARLVSVAVAGGTAQKIVGALVAQTRINLVLLESKSVPVTLKLKDVPLSEAVRHLCAMANLRYLKLPRTYVIGPEEALKSAYGEAYAQQYPAPEKPATDPAANGGAKSPPPAAVGVTRVLKLSNISATAAASALKPMFDARGVIAVAAPSVVSPTLVTLDTASTGSSSNAGATNSTTADIDRASRLLILSGPENEVAAAMALVASIDVPRAQVRVDVTIHDVNNDALRDLGVSWNFGAVNLTEQSDRSFLFGRFDRTNISATAVIHALETSDRARLLASPNVTVPDGDRGFVLMGDRLLFPVVRGFSDAGTPIFDTSTERVGIFLQVGASISDDGTVTMTLAPQVSTVKGFIQVNGGSYPQIATREAQTTIRVKSGEAVVLAGLMRDEEIRSMEKVPILGDLPFLGELFRRRKTQRSASQLIITVTPTIMKP